jgi:serine palmitoyltransferase
MVCGDVEVTIGSSIAAHTSAPRQKDRDNLIFIARSAPHSVTEGVSVARGSSARKLLYYDTLHEVQKQFRRETSLNKRAACLTVYVDAVDQDGAAVDLIPVLRFIARASKKELHSVCLFLDDRNGLGKIGPHSLGSLDYMEEKHGVEYLAREHGKRAFDVKVLVAGSWYNAFGHQGGYVLGAADVIEYLTWDARAYFFSTPPMPLQTAMSEKALELLQEGHTASD